MEVNEVTAIRTPEIMKPKHWRADMKRVPGARQMRFHTDRWYDNGPKKGVVSSPGKRGRRKRAKPGDVCIYFKAGKGAKKEGLRANCEFFFVEDQLWRRLTWKDVRVPVFMQFVNTYLDMGDTSGNWMDFGRAKAINHLAANPAHGLHIKGGDVIQAVFRGADAKKLYHMELPLEDPNDAIGPIDHERWAVDQAAREAGWKTRAQGLRLVRGKRLIYFIVKEQLTDAVKEAIGRAL